METIQTYEGEQRKIEKDWRPRKMSLHTKKKLHPNRQFKRHGNFEGRWLYYTLSILSQTWLFVDHSHIIVNGLSKDLEDVNSHRDSHPFGVPEENHGSQGVQGRRRQEIEDFRRETEEFRRKQEPRRSGPGPGPAGPGGSRNFRGNSFSLSPSSHSRSSFPGRLPCYVFFICIFIQTWISWVRQSTTASPLPLFLFFFFGFPSQPPSTPGPVFQAPPPLWTSSR